MRVFREVMSYVENLTLKADASDTQAQLSCYGFGTVVFKNRS